MLCIDVKKRGICWGLGLAYYKSVYWMGKKNEGPGRQQDRTRHSGQPNANCIKIDFSFRNCTLKIPKESRTSREKLVIKAHLENVSSTQTCSLKQGND